MRATPSTPTDGAVTPPAAGRERWRFADWPLRTKLLATILPLALLPLITLLLLGNTTETLTAEVKEKSQSEASALKRQLENTTAKIAQEVLIVAGSADAVVFGTPSGRNAFLVRLNSEWGYPRIDAFDPSGSWVGGTTETGPAANPADRDWFRTATQLPAVEVVFSDAQPSPGGGPPRFDVASPVYRFDGRLLGIVRFQWDPSGVSELASTAAGPGQRVDVLSRS